LIFFYAQGSKLTGLGHLSRTIRLSALFSESNIPHDLVFDLDSYAKNWILSRGIKYSNIKDVHLDKFDCVVIDAIHVNNEQKALLSRCNRRIIISPVCNIFHIATHILVRELAKDARLAISDSIHITVDESFSFITSEMEVNEDLDFTTLEIGVCLSGGSQIFPYELFLDYIDTTPSISGLTIVGGKEKVTSKIPINQISHQKTSEDLWHQLKHINLFIGRQGLMVAEALAKSLPVITLTETSESLKYTDFIERGIVKNFEISEHGFKQMSNFMSEASNVHGVNKKVTGHLKSGDSSSLFRALSGIIK